MRAGAPVKEPAMAIRNKIRLNLKAKLGWNKKLVKEKAVDGCKRGGGKAAIFNGLAVSGEEEI